jgi:hypothetical protein
MTLIDQDYFHCSGFNPYPVKTTGQPEAYAGRLAAVSGRRDRHADDCVWLPTGYQAANTGFM